MELKLLKELKNRILSTGLANPNDVVLLSKCNIPSYIYMNEELIPYIDSRINCLENLEDILDENKK